MLIDRLIDDYPSTVAGYEDFTEQELVKGVHDYLYERVVLDPKQISSLVMAIFLKHRNKWLGDHFFVNGQTYILTDIDRDVENEEDLITTFIQLMATKNPSLIGTNVDKEHPTQQAYIPYETVIWVTPSSQVNWSNL